MNDLFFGIIINFNNLKYEFSIFDVLNLFKLMILNLHKKY